MTAARLQDLDVDVGIDVDMSALDALATPAQTLRTIRLHGALAKRFGRVYKLAVASAGEAVLALCAVVPGFEAYLRQHSEPGYRVWVEKSALTVDQLGMPVGTRESIRIAPVMVGAKKNGVGTAIVGAVLVAAAFAVDYYTGGSTSAFTSGLKQMGVAMILGGVVQMLSPQRNGKDDTTAGKASYSFGGVVNTTDEGVPVPLAYGRVWAGSVVVSGGINTTDINVPGPAPAVTAPLQLPPEQPIKWDTVNSDGP